MIATSARYRVTAFALSLAALAYMQRVAISQAAGSIQTDLGLDKSQIGLVFGAFGLVAWSLFTALTGAAWSFLSLWIIRFLFGAGEAGCFPNLTRMLSTWLPARSRLRAQALMWACSRWAGAATPLLVLALVRWQGWRWAFVVLAVLGFIWAAVFHRWFRDDPAQHPSVNAEELELLRDSRVLTMQEGEVQWQRALLRPARVGDRGGHAFDVATVVRWVRVARRRLCCLPGVSRVKLPWRLLGCALLLASAHANELDMTILGKPPTTSWPTFNGDYTGARFSTLKQINTSNVASLQLQWSYRISEVGSQRGAPVPVIKATPLMVNGILYFTIPNNVYAVDARTGAKLWNYSWVDHGGHLVGNRGLGMYRNRLYFLGPDDWVICVDSNTGKEHWRKQIADARLQYFTTTAPLVVKNHVLVGVGGDAMDIRGFLVSLDPDTGDVQWKWWSHPGRRRAGYRELAVRGCCDAWWRRMTGTTPNRRCSSTPMSTAGPVSSSRKRREMAGSWCWIGRTAGSWSAGRT